MTYNNRYCDYMRVFVNAFADFFKSVYANKTKACKNTYTIECLHIHCFQPEVFIHREKLNLKCMYVCRA